MIIPTLDLVIEYGKQGVIVVRRKINPYKNVWALPGLRIYKGEDIDDAIRRIAIDETSLNVNTKDKIFLGQYVGRFKTENQREDISTCYLVHASDNQDIKINRDHFSSFRITKTIPDNAGSMYKYYLNEYFRRISNLK